MGFWAVLTVRYRKILVRNVGMTLLLTVTTPTNVNINGLTLLIIIHQVVKPLTNFDKPA